MINTLSEVTIITTVCSQGLAPSMTRNPVRFERLLVSNCGSPAAPTRKTPSTMPKMPQPDRPPPLDPVPLLPDCESPDEPPPPPPCGETGGEPGDLQKQHCSTPVPLPVSLPWAVVRVQSCRQSTPFQWRAVDHLQHQKQLCHHRRKINQRHIAYKI